MTHRVVEDPRIAGVARLEHADMVAELVRRYAGGADFWHAREMIAAEHGPRLAKLYGKETADRAVRALLCVTPRDMPAAAEGERAVDLLDRHARMLDDWHGPGHYVSPLGRAVARRARAVDAASTLTACLTLGAMLAAVLGGLVGWWTPFRWLAAGAGLGWCVLWALDRAHRVRRRRIEPPLSGWDLAVHRAAAHVRAVDAARAELTAQAEAERSFKAAVAEQRSAARLFNRLAADAEGGRAWRRGRR